MAMRIRRVETDDRGATATEYAILVAFIAIVIVAGVTVFGVSLDGLFTRLAAKLP